MQDETHGTQETQAIQGTQESEVFTERHTFRHHRSAFEYETKDPMVLV
jgi:hypothetical protein